MIYIVYIASLPKTVEDDKEREGKERGRERDEYRYIPYVLIDRYSIPSEEISR